MCACESWTVNKIMERNTSFWNDNIRRMLGISWKDKRTNEWVRSEVERVCGFEPEYYGSHCKKEVVQVLRACGTRWRDGESSDGSSMSDLSAEEVSYQHAQECWLYCTQGWNNLDQESRIAIDISIRRRRLARLESPSSRPIVSNIPEQINASKISEPEPCDNQSSESTNNLNGKKLCLFMD
ncbi:hypothetical protein GQR58_011177 [Nymphon striatum]|nr:hypothetical protein GQR58_011177 [Nymphon striatum]